MTKEKWVLSQHPRVETVKWLYSQKVVPALASQVTEAEFARQRGDHEKIRETFRKWAGSRVDGITQDQKILGKMERVSQETGVDLQGERDLTREGLTGLGRIQHVDCNSSLKRAEEEAKTPLIVQIDDVKDLYERIDVASLPMRTIHGSGIYWPVEIAQDRANTELTRGRIETGLRILEETRERVAVKYFDLSRKFSASSISSIEYQEYLGVISGFAVLLKREAQLKKRQRIMRDALWFMTEAHSLQPNTHRLATLAIWTIRASLSPDFVSEGFRARMEGVAAGTRELLRAIRENPKTVFLATSQFFREK